MEVTGFSKLLGAVPPLSQEAEGMLRGGFASIESVALSSVGGNNLCGDNVDCSENRLCNSNTHCGTNEDCSRNVYCYKMRGCDSETNTKPSNTTTTKLSNGKPCHSIGLMVF